jgi:hypothetical protein
VGGGVRPAYHVPSHEPLSLKLYTPNVLAGVDFVYDTGAQHVYLNYDTARLLFGPDYFDINRNLVVRVSSVDAYGNIAAEYLFPPVRLQVAHPSSRVRSTIIVNPVVSKLGLNLLGIKGICQLPWDVVFDRVEERARPYQTLPADW